MAIHARSPVQNVGIKHLNNSKRFIEHSDTMNDICNNIDDYNSTRKRKILIVFDVWWYDCKYYD